MGLTFKVTVAAGHLSDMHSKKLVVGDTKGFKS